MSILPAPLRQATGLYGHAEFCILGLGHGPRIVSSPGSGNYTVRLKFGHSCPVSWPAEWGRPGGRRPSCSLEFPSRPNRPVDVPESRAMRGAHSRAHPQPPTPRGRNSHGRSCHPRRSRAGTLTSLPKRRQGRLTTTQLSPSPCPSHHSE